MSMKTILRKLLRFRVIFPVLLAAFAFQIVFIVIPEVKAELDKRTVQIGGLPSGYALSSFEHTENEYRYRYENENGVYITLRYMPDTDMSLKGYLESQGVHAKYTTIITPNQGGMWLTYGYSRDKENINVVDPGDGLFILSGSMDSYSLGEIIRSVSIRK